MIHPFYALFTSNAGLYRPMPGERGNDLWSLASSLANLEYWQMREATEETSKH